MLTHSIKVMNHSKSKSTISFVELSVEEYASIFGGDNITQTVFRYLGSVWAGIEAGQPYASYGYYAGMNNK